MPMNGTVLAKTINAEMETLKLSLVGLIDLSVIVNIILALLNAKKKARQDALAAAGNSGGGSSSGSSGGAASSSSKGVMGKGSKSSAAAGAIEAYNKAAAKNNYQSGSDKRNQQKAIDKCNTTTMPGRTSKMANKTNTSKVPSVRPNWGIKCPKCGHYHCGCKFHTWKPDGSGSQLDPDKGEDDGKGDEDTPPEDGGGSEQPGEDGAVPPSGGGDDGSPGSGGGNSSGGGYGAADIDAIIAGVAGAMSALMALFMCNGMGRNFDVHFQTMHTPTPTMNISLAIAAGTLCFSFLTDIPLLNPLEIATKVALYFKLTILPVGIPALGVITQVINTADTILMPMAQELVSLSMSGGDDKYESLCNCVIKYVQMIVWTVTEINPATGAPVVFPVMIL